MSAPGIARKSAVKGFWAFYQVSAKITAVLQKLNYVVG
jgi:hypothetical protein